MQTHCDAISKLVDSEIMDLYYGKKYNLIFHAVNAAMFSARVILGALDYVIKLKVMFS